MNDLYFAERTLGQEIDALLYDFPTLRDDPQLRADMLEGATSFTDLIQRALDKGDEARTMAMALDIRIKELVQRREAQEGREEEMRGLIHRLMNRADITKVALPEGTMTIHPGRKSVVVEDINALPQGYYTTHRKADSKAIAAAIDAGEMIPGAKMVTGNPYLSIRRA